MMSMRRIKGSFWAVNEQIAHENTQIRFPIPPPIYQHCPYPRFTAPMTPNDELIPFLCVRLCGSRGEVGPILSEIRQGHLR